MICHKDVSCNAFTKNEDLCQLGVHDDEGKSIFCRYQANKTSTKREVRVHCTRTYPQADQSAARNLETTNHKSACGVVAVTMHPNYPG